MRGRRADEDIESAVPLHADYLRGIRHLVNDDSDRAIESFVRALDVDNETVETHLALGNLFRRQGEVDRALRIHENLVARPSLSTDNRNLARYELARDYLCAGVLDRAEGLFQDLMNQNLFRDRTMSGLVTIYEQEREWERAIDITRRLEKHAATRCGPLLPSIFVSWPSRRER